MQSTALHRAARINVVAMEDSDSEPNPAAKMLEIGTNGTTKIKWNSAKATAKYNDDLCIKLSIVARLLFYEAKFTIICSETYKTVILFVGMQSYR